MKSGLFRSTSCAFALLLVAACGDQGGSASNVASDSAADTTAAFTAAAEALSAKLQAGIPAATDPAVKAFDEQTAKGLKTLGTPALPVRGFDSYDALCGKTAAIAGAYVNAGVDSVPPAGKANAMNRNAERYMDQLFMPLLFSAHCTAAHMPFLEEKAGGDVSGKAAALQQVRAGAYGQVAGLLQMAGASDLDGDRRSQVVELLARDAGNFAIAFSQAQRQELAQAAEGVRGNLPDAAKGGIDKIKSALAGAPCGPLCKM